MSGENDRRFFLGESMSIRKTEHKDLDTVFAIYAHAREQMKKNGNPTQWGDTHPARALIEEDVERGTSYVIEENGEIVGVFAFIPGEDPTYRYIEGEWLNNAPYGTVHRIASAGKRKGIFETCLAFCEAQAENVRVDTHADNAIMQHLLEKFGYRRCGVIYVRDGSPRVAYQKEIRT